MPKNETCLSTNYFGAWFKNEKPISMGLIEEITPEQAAKHPFYSPEGAKPDHHARDAAGADHARDPEA
ncbi:hypothetical protein [Paracoccus mutanolyticus]|uniref:hypothetical protein n=1 Tax=Paracoccus mutanolyticus TaxID=1499308 RepID=UPI0011AE21CA|nr:hypothetical protein [Paracoccus mutanolyticus]